MSSKASNISSNDLQGHNQPSQITLIPSPNQESTEPTTTPLPWRQIIILLIVRIAEPISFTILFPFVYFMVKDFHLTDDDKQIAYYVGFIASSFAIAQTISGIPWGLLSDRIGRKPVMIMGLFGTSINLFLFGLSTSLPWAIVTRSLCGLLNGNVGVVKSMMAELTDSTNRAQGFSLLPMMFGLGSIVGPMIGGFLSKPVQNFPFLFEDGVIKDFLTAFPYFLPCATSAFFLLLSAIFGFFYLEETLDKISEPSPFSNKKPDEVEPLLQPNSSARPLYNSISSTKLSDSTILCNNPNIEASHPKKATSGVSALSSNSWKAILGYAGLSLQSVMQDELFPVWAASPFIYGGLNFNTPDIGVTMAFGGASLLAIQLLFYAPTQKKLGTLATYRISFLFYTPVVLMFPFISLLTNTAYQPLLWPAVILLVGARAGCSVFSFTSINILIAETSPNKKTLGLINGIAQCSGSFMRAIGPSLCGIIYSWSLSNNYNFPLLKSPFTWIIIGFISLANYVISLRITASESSF